MTPRDRRPDNERGPVNWGIVPKKAPRAKNTSTRPGGNGRLEVIRPGNNPAPSGSSASAASATGSADGGAGSVGSAGRAAVMTEEDMRSAAAQARRQAEAEAAKKVASASNGRNTKGRAGKGSQSSQRGSGPDGVGAPQPGTELVTLTVPGTKVLVPESTGRRELTTPDVVSGPVTTALAATSLGRAADERLAGTSTGETLIRVGQLLLGATGFVLVALGLASILGQVIS